MIGARPVRRLARATRFPLAMALALAGCAGSSTALKSEGASNTGGQVREEPQQPVKLAVPEGAITDGAPCDLGNVYFAFDSNALDEQSRDTISRSVSCFRLRSAGVTLHLTGSADDRGPEEYNLALGQRRASTVRNYMTSLGIAGERMSIHSVGEEMATGTDESSRALDRHVASVDR